MIVTCEECSTRFQLDEARIPASGAQVRCSHCKHAFFLQKPSPNPSQSADAIAAEAAEDPIAGVPPVASDAPAPEIESEESEESEELQEEEEWEFSEEIRNEGDEEPESESDFGVSEDFGSELDADELLDGVDDVMAGADDPPDALDSSAAIESAALDTGATSGLELESDPEPAEPVRDESDFGSVDDFSSLMEDDDVTPVDLGSEIESELEAASSDAPSAGLHAASGTKDDLGDPESWDLVADHDSAAGKSGAGAVRAPSRSEALGSGVAFEDESGESVYQDETLPVSPLWQVLGRFGHGVGWAVTIGLVVAVFGLGMHSEWTRQDPSPQTISAGALTARTTTSSWVETSRSGFVLIVAGEVQNTGRVPVLPGVVQLVLLDAAGVRLTDPPIQAGVRLPESVVREASPDELLASVAAAAASLRSTPLAPGESRAFEAIAIEDQLPETARRVLLEIGAPEAARRVPLKVGAPEPEPAPVRPAQTSQLEEESDFSL